MSSVSNIAVLNAGNNFNNLTISAAGTVTQTGLVDVSGTLTVNAGAVLATGTFPLTVAGLAANMAGGISGGAAGAKTISGNVSIAALGFFAFGAATWTFSGSWTNGSTSGSWSAGTATIVFNSAVSRVMTFGSLGVAEFNDVQFSPTAAATFTMATNGMRWAGTLTLNNAATLATANLALTGPGGALTVNNGATLTAGTSTVSVTNVTMTGGTSGTITTSGTWTVVGNWDTSGAGSTLSATASAVTMNGAARTVKILDVSNGFGALTISGTVSAASVLTTAGLLTVSGTLDTTATNYSLSIGGGLTVSGATGVLRTNASIVSVVGSVNINNPAGYITSTGAGLWTFTGASTTLALATGQMFYSLVIGGTISITSPVGAAGTLTVNNGAVLTKTGQSITFNVLTEIGSGSIADGATSVGNFSVTNSDATNLTTITVFTAWTVDSQYTWTDSSTLGTSTITFTIGGNTVGYRFNVMKDAAGFTNGIVNGSGQVVFAMLGSDPVVDVILSAPCGVGNRYWIGGTGSWSPTAHWSSSSGGVNGCSVPNASNPVFFDANSAGGTVSVDLNAALSSLNTTGWTGTVVIGVFDFAVSGAIIHGAGTLTIGASAGSGLTATGGLTLTGSAVLDGSGAPSVVSISGNLSISSAAAYLKMGSATWTFHGSWTNNSTSANWAAGTGTVVFDSTSSQTMTFAALAGSEFHSVTFRSAAGRGSVTFSMATNGLRWNNRSE